MSKKNNKRTTAGAAKKAPRPSLVGKSNVSAVTSKPKPAAAPPPPPAAQAPVPAVWQKSGELSPVAAKGLARTGKKTFSPAPITTPANALVSAAGGGSGVTFGIGTGPILTVGELVVGALSKLYQHLEAAREYPADRLTPWSEPEVADALADPQFENKILELQGLKTVAKIVEDRAKELKPELLMAMEIGGVAACSVRSFTVKTTYSKSSNIKGEKLTAALMARGLGADVIEEVIAESTDVTPYGFVDVRDTFKEAK